MVKLEDSHIVVIRLLTALNWFMLENVVGCQPFEFECNLDKICINITLRCNLDFDCTDYSDEDNCVFRQVCPEGEFRCRSGLCIVSDAKCNGIVQCPDGSDEDICGTTSVEPILTFVQTPSDLTLSDLYTLNPIHSSLDSYTIPYVYSSLFLEFIPIPLDSYNVTVVTTLTSSVAYSSFNKRVSEMYLTLMTPVNTILPPVYEMDVSVSDKRSVFSASAVSSQYNMIIESTHSIEPIESTTLVSSKPIVAAVSEVNKRDIWIPTIIAIAVLICLIIIIVLAYKYREQIRKATRNNTVGDRLNTDMDNPDMDVESSGQPSKEPLSTVFSYKDSTTDTNVKEKTDISLYL